MHECEQGLDYSMAESEYMISKFKSSKTDSQVRTRPSLDLSTSDVKPKFFHNWFFTDNRSVIITWNYDERRTGQACAKSHLALLDKLHSLFFVITLKDL